MSLRHLFLCFAAAAAPCWLLFATEASDRRIFLLRARAEPGRARLSFERLELGRISNADRIATGIGGQHVLVLTADGEVWSWGLNGQGQPGAGDRESREGWIRLQGLTEVIQVAAGSRHSVALRADGTVWTWGGNLTGELGDGTVDGRAIPTLVEGLEAVKSIAAGPDFTLVLRKDGSVFAWGNNRAGLVPGLTSPVVTRPMPVPGLGQVVRIAVIGDECYALDGLGKWRVWNGGPRSERELLDDEAILDSAGGRAKPFSPAQWKTLRSGEFSVRAVPGFIEVWGAVPDRSENLPLLDRFPVAGAVIDLSAGESVAWIEEFGNTASAGVIGPPSEGPELGPAPTAPLIPKSKVRLSEALPQAAGEWINTASKAAVIAAYSSTYLPALSVPMDWTGSVVTGDEGTTSQAYKDAVAVVINWYRGMAGVPTAVALDPVYSAKDQKAALMFAANNALSHNPPTTWKWYSAEGDEAAGKSNICMWSSGMPTGCIDAYMRDDGSNNTAVGHRRWILYPQTRTMGTGDVSSTPSNPSSNALWVLDGNYGTTRPATRESFVAWPSPGYFPYDRVPARWSFSYAGASFSAATVSVRRDGLNLPVSLLPVANGYGENTLVWTLSGWDSSRPPADSTAVVTVSNVVVNGVPQNFTYQVIVFDTAATASFVPSKIGLLRSGVWHLDMAGDATGVSVPVRSSSFWAGAGSQAVLGDWNGDGKTEIGVYLNGGWYLDYNGNGAWDSGTDKQYSFGWAGAAPMVGDWNGDGKAEIGLYADGIWYLDYNGTGSWEPGTDRVYYFGWSGVTPQAGDWNGDGRTKIGLYGNGIWYLDYNGTGAWEPANDKLYYFGWAGVTPLAGDWNGDGKTKIGLYSSGIWYLDYNGSGLWEPESDRLYYFGWSGVTPVLGDWNSDGKIEIGIYDNGWWYLDRNGSGAWEQSMDRLHLLGGQNGDTPLSGRW